MNVSNSDAISAQELQVRAASPGCVLLDVRERDEFARERIPGARHAALSSLGADTLPALGEDEHLVVYCASGARSREALARLRAMGIDDAVQLHGGLGAWKAAGFQTAFDARVPISIMRQVQITAGALILLGAVLGALVSPWFHGLSAFVGAGLAFAGLSGTCAMARLLEHMPWNQVHGHAAPMSPGAG